MLLASSISESIMTGVEELISKCGSPAEVAAKLTTPERPCSRQLVEYWVKRGYVTGTWAPLVTRAFGVPLHKLNPAVYPEQLTA